jgi:hypothetical protein
VLLGASPASADPPHHRRQAATRPADRRVPDYDSLPDPGDDVGDVFLWTARILTSPLYLLTEYVIRRPLGWAATEIERHHVIEDMIDFFTFGPNDNIVLVPTAFYEFEFQPSVGLYASWDEFLFRENRISTHAGFGGPDWLTWTITDRIRIADRWQFGTRFLARKRPDFVFGGIGSDATQFPRARFGAERLDATLFSSLRYWQRSDVEFEVQYRAIDFIDQGWNREPSVGERAAALNQPLPYGFETGYEAIGGEIRADLDTRSPGGPPEGGVQIAAHAGEHAAFGDLSTVDRWISWGGSTTLATDVLARHRVLGITVEADLITPLNDSNVPFTELIDTDGPQGLLPGYFPGQIQGLSAAGAIAHYTWPIWAFLDSRLYFGLANAFDLHLTDFDLEKLRLSFGFALVPRIEDSDLPFEANFAFATETFENGASLDSFRLAIGVRELL